MDVCECTLRDGGDRYTHSIAALLLTAWAYVCISEYFMKSETARCWAGAANLIRVNTFPRLLLALLRPPPTPS